MLTTDDHETIGAALVRASVAEDNTVTLEEALDLVEEPLLVLGQLEVHLALLREGI